MSLKDLRKYNFHSLKSLLRADGTFSFYVTGKARKMETQYGTGWYLLGQRVGKGTKEKNLDGLLKISPTTIGTIADVTDTNTSQKIQHLDDLEGMIIDFEFDENVRTVVALAVREWGS